MIAGGKGHGGCSWFLGGFLFGPLALLATIGLRDRKNDLTAQRLVATQEEMLDEIQRKHDWERRQWQREIERQYLAEDYSQSRPLRLSPSQEMFDEEVDDEFVDVDAVVQGEDRLIDYLHTLEYDEEVPELLTHLLSLGIETKSQFIDRLKWSCEIVEGVEVEELFAEHIWIDNLNKSESTDYGRLWLEDLESSFLVLRTADNAYFLRRQHS
jgi:hypothetical protein